MEGFRSQGPFLPVVFILLLGAPVAMAEECNCRQACTVWIVLAATIPTLIIVILAVIIKCCLHFSRKRARQTDTENKLEEVTVEDPVYDSYKDSLERPVQSTRTLPELPPRHLAQLKTPPKQLVITKAEIAPERSKRDTESNIDDKSRRRRKKTRKLTDRDKADEPIKEGLNKNIQNSQSHSVRNTLFRKRDQQVKPKSVKSENGVKNFSNLVSISECAEENSDDSKESVTDEEKEVVTSTGVNQVTPEDNKKWQDVVNYLDEAIASNHAVQTAKVEESDMDASELQALFDKALVQRLSRDSSFHSVDFFELSRPNTPVPDVETVAALDDPEYSFAMSNRRKNSDAHIHVDDLEAEGLEDEKQRSDTPAVFTQASDTLSLKHNPFSVERKGFNDSVKPIQKLVAEEPADDDIIKGIQEASVRTPSATVSLPIRSQTPGPFGSSIDIKHHLPLRSKTPDPSVKKHGNKNVVQKSEKFFSSPIGPLGVDEAKTVQSSPVKSKNNTGLKQTDEIQTAYINKKLDSGNIQLQRNLTDSQRSQTPNPFIVQHTKSLRSRSKTPDPITSRNIDQRSNHSPGLGTNSRDENASKIGNKFSKHSKLFQVQGPAAFSEQSSVKRQMSNKTEEPDVLPRSQTPDQFGSPRKDTKQKERDRSKTPDLFTSKTIRTSEAETTVNKQPEKRLDRMVKLSNSQGKVERGKQETNYLNDLKFRQRVADIPIRAKTPDPVPSTAQGLVYNEHFASNMRRSKSVNAPNRIYGRDKLLKGEAESIPASVTNNDQNTKSNGESSLIQKTVFGERTLQNIMKEKPKERSSTDHLPEKLKSQIAVTHNFPNGEHGSKHERNQMGQEETSKTNDIAYDKLMNITSQNIENARSVSEFLKQSDISSRQENEAQDLSEGASRIQGGKGMEKLAAKLRSRHMIKEMGDDDIDDNIILKNESMDSEKQKDLYDRLIQDMKRKTGPFSSKTKLEPYAVEQAKPMTGRVQFRTSTRRPDTMTAHMAQGKGLDESAHNGLFKSSPESKFRPQSLDEVGAREFHTRNRSQSEKPGIRKLTESDKFDIHTLSIDSSVNRSKSLSERNPFNFDGTGSDDENRRKRKHSSLKIALPDLNAIPRKGILKNSTSPPSDGLGSLAVFPLSQFAEENASSMTTRFSRSDTPTSNAGGKGRSIVFSETSFISNSGSGDGDVTRSMSHNRRPPTPMPLNIRKKKRLLDRQDWRVTTTKF